MTDTTWGGEGKLKGRELWSVSRKHAEKGGKRILGTESKAFRGREAHESMSPLRRVKQSSLTERSVNRCGCQQL